MGTRTWIVLPEWGTNCNLCIATERIAYAIDGDDNDACTLFDVSGREVTTIAMTAEQLRKFISDTESS